MITPPLPYPWGRGRGMGPAGVHCIPPSLLNHAILVRSKSAFSRRLASTVLQRGAASTIGLWWAAPTLLSPHPFHDNANRSPPSLFKEGKGGVQHGEHLTTPPLLRKEGRAFPPRPLHGNANQPPSFLKRGDGESSMGRPRSLRIPTLALEASPPPRRAACCGCGLSSRSRRAGNTVWPGARVPAA